MFRTELDQIFQELQPVAAGAEVPVEHGEVDGIVVGDAQRRLGVRGDEHLQARFGRRQPFLERPTHGLFIVDDQYGVLHSSETHPRSWFHFSATVASSSNRESLGNLC